MGAAALTLGVTDSVEAVKKRHAANSWQPFVTLNGNICKIDTGEIIKTSLRVPGSARKALSDVRYEV